MKAVLMIIFVVAMLIFGAVQLYAGWLGIAHLLGQFWSFAALLALFFMRVLLPFTIGAFFCARDLWDWHWALALLFAAPGLALSVPSVVAVIFGFFKRKPNY